MLKRQIIGVMGISLWAAAVLFAAAAGLKSAKANVESMKETAEIETLAKDLVSALAEGDYEKATENFDETMKNKVSAENLEKAWNSLIDQVGPFEEQAGIRREKKQQYDVIFVTCKFEKGILDTKVVFNEEQQVAGLFFVPSQGAAK